MSKELFMEFRKDAVAFSLLASVEINNAPEALATSTLMECALVNAYIEKAISFYDGQFALNISTDNSKEILPQIPPCSNDEEASEFEKFTDSIFDIEDDLQRRKKICSIIKDAVTKLQSSPVDESKKVASGYAALAMQHAENAMYYYLLCVQK